MHATLAGHVILCPKHDNDVYESGHEEEDVFWLQGVYTTFYGPHGMEALHITYGTMDPPLSTLLPHGKCFAGLKVKR